MGPIEREKEVKMPYKDKEKQNEAKLKSYYKLKEGSKEGSNNVGSNDQGSKELSMSGSTEDEGPIVIDWALGRYQTKRDFERLKTLLNARIKLGDIEMGGARTI